MSLPIEVAIADGVRVCVRGRRPEDEPFIYDSWMKSYRAAAANEGVPGKIYRRNQTDTIGKLLLRAETVVLCDVEHTDHILGYSVSELEPERSVLHWMFVKFSFRRFGLARWMLENITKRTPDDAELYISHLPPNDFIHHMKEQYRLIYDPSTKE